MGSHCSFEGVLGVNNILFMGFIDMLWLNLIRLAGNDTMQTHPKVMRKLDGQKT